MEFINTKIIICALLIIILLMIITIFVILKKKGKTDPLVQKGELGEMYLYQCLKDLPEPKRILYHVYLPTGGDETTEVDLIMIHGTGIYVFENKNYTGYIKGRENKSKWCQYINDKKKRFFYNPIMQNEGHIRALKKVLRSCVDPQDFYSIIVFGDYCKIGRIRIRNSGTFVVGRRDTNELCYRLMKRGRCYYDEDQVEQIYGCLLKFINVNKSIRKKHVDDVRKKYGNG